MKTRLATLDHFRRPHSLPLPRRLCSRTLLTLAIETSCDDTSVALVEKKRLINGNHGAIIHFHKKVTSNNTTFQGVHPLVSLKSHQENLAILVREAIQNLPTVQPEQPSQSLSDPAAMQSRPDFISVTRGPGMRSNLFVGLDTAKGLATAWELDIVGVHHMQAHALTPRLVVALRNTRKENINVNEETFAPRTVEPAFPFLSVLASGGHTLITHSASLTDHKVLGSSTDIAVGECLDKVARAVLPPDILQTSESTMYGALLEQFAFPGIEKGRIQPKLENGIRVADEDVYRMTDSTAAEYCASYGTRTEYGYTVPKTQEIAQTRNQTSWGWALNQPLATAAGGLKNKSMDMSFAGLLTYAERIVRFGIDPSTGKLSKDERSFSDMSIEERRQLAQEAMRAAFEHIVYRVVWSLQLQQTSAKNPGTSSSQSAKTVVMAGGVAANTFFRYILASVLSFHGYEDVRIVFPPASLCTDNAAMIGWTGLEMYEAGHVDSLRMRAIRKWPLNELLAPPEHD
ncbi:hypothetical protein EJ04DRAFT_423163 [Polyplosphaeria fusca]|uniref:N(6)-L-threonylcarbamoyladenine synthase n=1 Tax=Polyplosphaeria fusca TaxID=682080 RepID=A0A9P4V999_9PLEO|nr:hypothetical protein EJ04DRAFT_423163 [Polyplosphaeria fusca]